MKQTINTLKRWFLRASRKQQIIICAMAVTGLVIVIGALISGGVQ